MSTASTLAKKLPVPLCLFVLIPSPSPGFGVLSSQFLGDATGLSTTPFVTYNAPSRGGVDGEPGLRWAASDDGEGV